MNSDKKIVIVLADIEKKPDIDWYNKCKNKDRTIKKSNCSNASSLFIKTFIHFNFGYDNEVVKPVVVNIHDTKLSGDLRNIDDNIGNAINAFFSCLLKEMNISEGVAEHIILIHNVKLVPNPKFNVTSYSIGGNGDVRNRGKLLESLFTSFFEKKTDIEEIYQELKKNLLTEEDLHKEFLRNITLLKHLIAHLFLPIDIDLLGIGEVLSSNFKQPQGKSNEELAKDYLEDMLKDKPENGYLEKLVNLRYVITGDKKKAKINKIKPNKDKFEFTLDQNEVKEKNGVYKKMTELAGIDDKDNPIIKFLQKLDKGNVKPREVVDFFKNKNWEIKWIEIKDGNEVERKRKIESFHDWFYELIETFKDLQKVEISK